MRPSPASAPKVPVEQVGPKAARMLHAAVPVLWIPAERRVVRALAAMAFNAVVYLSANHHPRVLPRLLPLSGLDRAVPFLPQTLWIYLSDYFLLLGTYFVIRDERKAIRFLVAYSCLGAIAALVHWGIPVRYPRELFAADGGSGLTAWAVTTFRTVDSASSCMPSIHVGGAALAAFYLRGQRRWLQWLGGGWALAVAVTTLTMKQHYAVDGVGGLVLCWAVLVVLPAGPEA